MDKSEHSFRAEATFHVDQSASGPMVDTKEPEKQESKLTPEQEAAIKEVQSFIDGRKSLLTTFARDVSLNFRASSAFMINLETGDVHLDTNWFMKQGYSKVQILWAIYHELSHFRDLAEDPENMRENFGYIREQARETGDIILKKFANAFQATHPDVVASISEQRPTSRKDPTKTMNAAEMAAQRIHHRFFNIFDDIFVNSMVARHSPAYEPRTSGGDEVVRLYQEKLFPVTDFSAPIVGGLYPRHMQFCDKLLRETMVTGEETIVSPDVEEALNKKIKIGGRLMTPRQIVESYLRPKTGRDTSAGRRYEVLKETLEPIFQKLLMADIDDWVPTLPESGSEGGPAVGGIPIWKSEYDKYEEDNPDKFEDENVEDWVDKNDAGSESSPASGENEEDKPDNQAERDATFCKANNIDKKTFDQYAELRSSVSEYLDELARMWRKIVYGRSVGTNSTMVGHFKTGAALDVSEAIRRFPEISAGQLDNVRLLKRRVETISEIKKPELLRLRFMGDISSSMFTKDGVKIKVLRQCYVLLMESIEEFNVYLNATRHSTHSKLSADTEVWTFGHEGHQVKLFNEKKANGSAEVIRALPRLNDKEGWTYDHKALGPILESLTPADLQKMKAGKIMDIIIEVTDGGTGGAATSREYVDQLTKAGAIVRAFQIGDVSEQEVELFNQVWNDNREEPFGVHVGTNPANVIPALVKLLEKYLGHVEV